MCHSLQHTLSSPSIVTLDKNTLISIFEVVQEHVRNQLQSVGAADHAANVDSQAA